MGRSGHSLLTSSVRCSRLGEGMDMAFRTDRSRTPRIRLQLLGQVTASQDHEPIHLGPPLQRAVLCVLALRLGTPVSKQQLIDYVWGGRPPKTASQGVYTYISGLRRALE